MRAIFNVVADGLHWAASAIGMTYNEINIVAYYIILPFICIALLDRIIRKHILKVLYVGGWTIVLCLVRDFRQFSDVLFDRSVRFLCAFSAVGLDYVAASVVICVLLPLVALIVLLLFAFPTLRSRFCRYGKQSRA
jgi:hypothetical protein